MTQSGCAGAARWQFGTRVTLFRITQEALHNVEKHADATSATVEVSFADDDSVRLLIADEGHGYEPPEDVPRLVREGKLGILGMMERAELVGCSFQLRPADDKGCRVVVEVPGNARASSGATAT